MRGTGDGERGGVVGMGVGMGMGDFCTGKIRPHSALCDQYDNSLP